MTPQHGQQRIGRTTKCGSIKAIKPFQGITRIKARLRSKTIKRDYVAHMPKPDRETALRNFAISFEHYNEQHPHSALKYRSPRDFRRLAAASI